MSFLTTKQYKKTDNMMLACVFPRHDDHQMLGQQWAIREIPEKSPGEIAIF
jgi:hypothetical protein